MFAGSSIAHAGEPSCGGIEQPPCPKKENPPKKPPQPKKLQFVLTVNVIGGGHVYGQGISCPGDCEASLPEHTVVVLVPAANPGSHFRGWSGDCSGTGICVVVMDGSRSAGATFDPANVPLAEIGDPTDPVGGTGTAGQNTNVGLGFECYSIDDLWIDQLFVLLLSTEGDAAGIKHYTDMLTGGASHEDVALAFLQSAEYRTLLVRSWYQRFLHRSPTGEELSAGVGLLLSMSDEEAQATLLGSAEYLSSRGGNTNRGFVEALYEDLLGRAPTEVEQQTLDAAFGAGVTRAQVALEVLKSIEYRTLLIQSWFQNYLGRAATDVELTLFLQQFAAGATDEQLLAELLGSQEFIDGLDDYGAEIHWGDGSSTEVTVRHTTANGRICTVTGGHIFPNPGDINVTIVVTDPDGHTQDFGGVLSIKLPPPPPPGKANIQPFGTVLIKIGGKFVPLPSFRVIPIGSILDTTKGRVRLTSHDGSTGFFFQGQFQLKQIFSTVNGKKKPVTLLVLTGPLDACGARTTSGVGAKPKKKVIRHLWGNAKGSFRTKGKYASATVRGTQWETLDYCDGTLVIVKVGRVDVLNLVTNKHHFVTGGHSYFAPAP